jgi:hypothetical protein
VHDFQLDAVGIVEEHRVIPRHVPILLRAALDLGALRAEPFGPLADRGSRGGIEREVVQADPIAVVGTVGRRLRFSQTERGSGAGEVPDRLTALALDLADAVVAERREQLAVERQAALDRGDDEIDVVDAC